CSSVSLSRATYAGAGTSGSTTCSFNDHATYTVKARIIDKDGGATEYTTSVVVNNVDPVYTAPADQTANEGASKSFDLGSFSDPGNDSPWTIDVDWGDGSAADSYTVTDQSLALGHLHTYDDNGAYTITLTVTQQ